MSTRKPMDPRDPHIGSKADTRRSKVQIDLKVEYVQVPEDRLIAWRAGFQLLLELFYEERRLVEQELRARIETNEKVAHKEWKDFSKCIEHDDEAIWCQNCGGYCGVFCHTCGTTSDGAEGPYYAQEWCSCDNQRLVFTSEVEG